MENLDRILHSNKLVQEMHVPRFSERLHCGKKRNTAFHRLPREQIKAICSVFGHPSAEIKSQIIGIGGDRYRLHLQQGILRGTQLVHPCAKPTQRFLYIKSGIRIERRRYAGKFASCHLIEPIGSTLFHKVQNIRKRFLRFLTAVDRSQKVRQS